MTFYKYFIDKGNLRSKSTYQLTIFYEYCSKILKKDTMITHFLDAEFFKILFAH